MKPEVLALASDLSARGEPFVLATVVWRRAPSSGQPGATALITPDRTIHGWIGGACAEPTVIREGLRTLDDGEPKLLFLGTPEELEGHARDGVVTVPIACQSEGALEVYVEPVLPAPLVIVIGRSPVVDALAKMAVALGWRAAVVDDGGGAGDHPGVTTVIDRLDLRAAGVTPASCVVVATQGHYDEAALEAALSSGAAYVGLVASARRAATVLGYLGDRGADADALGRVHAPAGLDLGHLPTQDIAVAIMAQLVQLRAAGALPVAAVAEPVVHEEIDPVCHMTVTVADARFHTIHEAHAYYFCSAGCLASFQEDPERYLTPAG